MEHADRRHLVRPSPDFAEYSITMLGRIAEVYRHYHLTTAVADVEERYSVLQSCIQMLGEVFDDCPQLSETDPSYDFGAIASQEEYMLAWQRYSLTTTVYLSRLQFCRPFFVRAYSQPEFVMSRVVSLMCCRLLTLGMHRVRFLHDQYP